MTKISQLSPILADETASSDLFVTVNPAQGEDGTKNITRSELVKSTQREVFSDVKIDGGDYIRNIPINNAIVSTSLIQNSVLVSNNIENSNVVDSNIINPNITVNAEFAPKIDGEDYFYLKDVSLGETVAISYSQLYGEISETA